MRRHDLKFYIKNIPIDAHLLRWIKNAWDKVTPDIIRKSFKKCGISNAIDGSEDGLLFMESDSDTDSDADFEGFTQDDIDSVSQAAANLASTNFTLDSSSSESDSCSDASVEDNYDDPMSPGH